MNNGNKQNDPRRPPSLSVKPYLPQVRRPTLTEENLINLKKINISKNNFNLELNTWKEPINKSRKTNRNGSNKNKKNSKEPPAKKPKFSRRRK